jgi:CheY-like chemotaxis protein
MTRTPLLTGLHVVLVEDDADAREGLALILQGRGARVTAVGSAGDAFTAVSRDRPDVLVADIAMPDEDGYSLIRRVRATAGRHATIPAAAVTAHARDEERRAALEAGFQVHVAKPFEPVQLARAVETLVRGTYMVH